MQTALLAAVLATAATCVSGKLWTLRDPTPADSIDWDNPTIWYDEFNADGVPADGDDVRLEGANFILTIPAAINPNLNSLTFQFPFQSTAVKRLVGAANNVITVGAGGLTMNDGGGGTAYVQNVQINVGGPTKVDGPFVLLGATIRANTGGSIPGTTSVGTLALDSGSTVRLSGGFALNGGSNLSRSTGSGGGIIEFGDCLVATTALLDTNLQLHGPLYVANGRLTFKAPRTVNLLTAWAGSLRADGGVLTLTTATIGNTGGNAAYVDAINGGSVTVNTLNVPSGGILLGPNDVLSVPTALNTIPATATAAIVLPGMTIGANAMGLTVTQCAVLCDFTGIVNGGSWSPDIPAGGAIAINSLSTLPVTTLKSTSGGFSMNANSRLILNGPVDVPSIDLGPASTTVTLGNGARLATPNPVLNGAGTVVFANATTEVTSWPTNVVYTLPVGGQLYFPGGTAVPPLTTWAGAVTVLGAFLGGPVLTVSAKPAGVITGAASFGLAATSPATSTLTVTFTDVVFPSGFRFVGSGMDVTFAGTTTIPQGVTVGSQSVTFATGSHVSYPVGPTPARAWTVDYNADVTLTTPNSASGPFPLSVYDVVLRGPSKLSSANGNVIVLDDSAQDNSAVRMFDIGSPGFPTAAVTLDAVVIAAVANTNRKILWSASPDLPAEIVLNNGATIMASGGVQIQGSSTPARVVVRTGVNTQSRDTGLRVNGSFAITGTFSAINASTCMYVSPSIPGLSQFTHITAPPECRRSALYAGCNGNVCGTYGTACVPTLTGANCTCAAGWRGTYCSVNIACEAAPCANGGTCVPGAGTAHTCQCTNAFTGTTCSEPTAVSSTGSADGGTGGTGTGNGVGRTAASAVSVLLAIGVAALARRV